MKHKAMAWTLRLGYLVLALASYFGYRCPAQGCPCCKLFGK